MRFVLNVRKAFWLFGLPIVGDSDSFNFTKPTKSVTNIVLFEAVGQVLNKYGVAVTWHRFCHLFAYRWLSSMTSLSFFDVKVPATEAFTVLCQSCLIGCFSRKRDMCIPNTFPWVLKCRHFYLRNIRSALLTKKCYQLFFCRVVWNAWHKDLLRTPFRLQLWFSLLFLTIFRRLRVMQGSSLCLLSAIRI